MGKLTIPADNLVLAKDATAGIYANGLNATIQVSGKDEWYVVYHRFTYPKGIGIERAAGFSQKVCIDKMEFGADGSIKPVKPTQQGINPVRLKGISYRK